MTSDDINIKIAELCGWKFDDDAWEEAKEAEAKYDCYGPSSRSEFAIPPGGGGYGSMPDYCNDLNAMHEAESVLDAEQATIYAAYLREDVVFDGDIVSEERDFFVLHATAEQRATAFLKTLGYI